MTPDPNLTDVAASVEKAAEVAGADDLDQATVQQVILAWNLVQTAGGLSGERLASELAQQVGVPVANIAQADTRAAILIPAEVAHRWNVLPLRCNDRRITVATSNPGSGSCRRDIAWLTGRTVQFEVAAPGELHDAVVATYGPAPEWEATLAIVAANVPKGPHILVVDDEAGQRSLLRSVLEEGGFRVTVAKDGSSALELLAQEPSVDLVTLDYWMEGMNGLRVLQHVREGTAAAEVPVIMVTGSGDRRIEMSLFEAGADDFIAKPIDAPLLVLRIRAVLSRRHFRPTG